MGPSGLRAFAGWATLRKNPNELIPFKNTGVLADLQLVEAAIDPSLYLRRDFPAG
jgi:hypothetical protein